MLLDCCGLVLVNNVGMFAPLYGVLPVLLNLLLNCDLLLCGCWRLVCVLCFASCCFVRLFSMGSCSVTCVSSCGL